MSAVYVSQSKIVDIINDNIALEKFIKNTFDTEKCHYMIITGLNSSERHLIYKQMKYPYKFEKIQNDNERVSIRIYVNGSFDKRLPAKKRKIIKEPEPEPEPESKSESEPEQEESEYSLSEESEESSEYSLDNFKEISYDIKKIHNTQLEIHDKILNIEKNIKK